MAENNNADKDEVENAEQRSEDGGEDDGPGSAEFEEVMGLVSKFKTQTAPNKLLGLLDEAQALEQEEERVEAAEAIAWGLLRLDRPSQAATVLTRVHAWDVPSAPHASVAIAVVKALCRARHNSASGLEEAMRLADDLLFAPRRLEEKEREGEGEREAAMTHSERRHARREMGDRKSVV